MSNVFLDIDILPDGIEDWIAAYGRCESFLKENGAKYGLPADPSALDDEGRETVKDLYAADPAWGKKGEMRVDAPPAPRAGRIEIRLFTKECPKTAENFKCLCTGEKGKGKGSGKPLHFKGSAFHRVVKGFMAQGGDFVRGDGSGGDSIYNGKFNDEKDGLKLKHDKRGILSMANSGKNSNSSQFFFTFAALPNLDGKHVVFGEVTKGLEVLDKIEAVSNKADGPPTARVVIADCGAL